jgi:hypothetical protein
MVYALLTVLLTIAQLVNSSFNPIRSEHFSYATLSGAMVLKKGSKIETLDQLIGSLSVSSTIRTQISTGLHGSFTAHMLGVALVAL